MGDYSNIGEGLSSLFGCLMTIVVVLLLTSGFFAAKYFFTDRGTYKSKTKPTISYELEAKGQNVDTIWIYNFKQ